MSGLKEMARRCGGEVSGRDSFIMPGPGHGRRDRSLSVKRTPNGFVVHSFAGDDFHECRDLVASRLGLQGFDLGAARRQALPIQRTDPDDEPGEWDDVAARLWAWAVPIGGTLGERYFREVRSITCALPPTMRFLAARGAYPATIVTAFAVPSEPEPETMSMDGIAVTAIHLTRLAPDGTKLEKRMLGSPAGLPLVVAPWTETGRGLVLAEGLEDALSGHEATGLAAWAGGSAGHMQKLGPAVPSWCESVTILQHDDDAGRRATRSLAGELRQRGVEVLVMGGARG